MFASTTALRCPHDHNPNRTMSACIMDISSALVHTAKLEQLKKAKDPCCARNEAA
jgi:hypothetical protein